VLTPEKIVVISTRRNGTTVYTTKIKMISAARKIRMTLTLRGRLMRVSSTSTMPSNPEEIMIARKSPSTISLPS
jgi:hypothetical protein